ncbi:hypothetical protein CU048_01820 [Beijerinckiaceae bacterium]|nr:hypothetical protein CU048_01820 [Beijerinckiaceae bacterium]
MMPPPVLLACMILLGWPSLKLIATLLSLPKWRRLRDLQRELKADVRYAEPEYKIIELQTKEAKGEPLQVLLPVLTLVGGVGFSLVEFYRIKPSNLPELDPNMEIEDLRQQIDELRYRLADIDLPDTLPRSSALWKDSRFVDLQQLAFELAMLRYPVASIITGLSIIIVAPLVMIVEGLRASWKLIVIKIIHSSVYSSRAFARSVGVI